MAARVDSRTVTVFVDKSTGARVVAEKHHESAITPKTSEIEILRGALEHYGRSP
jgi:hypothetical protein